MQPRHHRNVNEVLPSLPAHPRIPALLPNFINNGYAKRKKVLLLVSV